MVAKKNQVENVVAQKKSPRISKTKKADLTMPVSRFHRYLKKGRYAPRISTGSAVYMASVVEYLVAEIVELAGNAAKANKKRTISPRFIMLGVRNDEELNKLFEHVHIAGGGVIPKLHPFLCPKKATGDETPKVSQEY